jgi:alanyl-tRNA synthetase
MKSAELRKSFLDYFKRNGHTVVSSSSLIPANDPTLLFTNAGMVQFKDVFLGAEKRDYKRATSSQRCVRAGGKHNDLENVGYTARHHTFFEMLGNFSFGDYFKREAIGFAWEFLTKDLGLPPERLWVTVYKDDDEAADIWLKEVGVDPTRFSRLGEKDNFWSMGDTGPCGPCSEIFYDHGEAIEGGPPGSPNDDGDRYVEIWNLVFMQFNRDASGNMTPLPKPSVDTGMGLERIAAVMQGVHSNYQIDLFQHLINSAAEILHIKSEGQQSLNVLADHIRSCAFLIADGVFPSNEGRGYVLRRIIRRAIRHGHKLGAKDSFFYKLVKPLAKEMGEAYPELIKDQDKIEAAIRDEEERFAETLENGMRILEQDIKILKGDTISGATAFQLYDTYGFPFDLTADIARERGLKVDQKGFDKEMEAQRERGRAAGHFEIDYNSAIAIDRATEFTGYDSREDDSEVVAMYSLEDSKALNEASEGDLAIVVLDHTPFYAESGGQVGDIGVLDTKDGRFEVRDTKKHPSGAILHIGRVEKGKLHVDERVHAVVGEERDLNTRLNHSATHLMHAALRKVLGDHVMQKGSLVGRHYLRFDFSHPKPVTLEQQQLIEDLVNEQIRANLEVETRLMNIDDAMKSGAMALFGEKYGEEVRVLRMGEFSVELCGGTHVSRTGDIGIFKITSESGVAAGIRRIEAVTGADAEQYIRDKEETLQMVAQNLKANPDQVVSKVEQLAKLNRELEKELDQLKAKLASAKGEDLQAEVEEINGVKVLATVLDGADAKSLRETMDRLKDKLGSAVIVLGSTEGDKVNLVAGVTKDLTERFHAGKLIGQVAAKVGGKGGGRPDMAQAGGKDPSGMDKALATVADYVRSA